MKQHKRLIGLITGLLLGLIVYFIPIPDLATPGHICLALSLMTVVFWAFGVAQPGYISGLYLVLLAVFDVAPKTLIFST